MDAAMARLTARIQSNLPVKRLAFIEYPPHGRRCSILTASPFPDHKKDGTSEEVRECLSEEKKGPGTRDRIRKSPFHPPFIKGERGGFFNPLTYQPINSFNCPVTTT
jgi:hypothetical protein